MSRSRPPVLVQVDESEEMVDLRAWTRRYVDYILKLEGISTTPQPNPPPDREAA